MSSFVIIDGNIWACGSNHFGQLGLGDCNDRNLLTKVVSDQIFVAVNCEHYHTIALDENGNMWTCGTHSV